MKHFLAVYTGSTESMQSWKAMNASERQVKERAGMEAWKAWVEKHAQSIVDNGTPLGKTKQISKQGIRDVRNNLTAYTVVQAESHEAAAKLFEGHPHFTIFPGDGVELMECLPLPEM